MIKIFAVLTIGLMLTGCSNSKFDCPATGGIFCKPVSEVDKMADRGAFAGKNRTVQKKKRSLSKRHQTLKGHPIHLHHADEHPPERVSDRVLQVWVAPFETTDGVYHQPSRINVVVEKGYWADRPFQVQEVH